MSPAVAELTVVRPQITTLTPSWSVPQPCEQQVIATPRRGNANKVGKAAGIAAGALVLGGMNVSGMFHENDWMTLLCMAPQTFALVAIFVTWFTAFLFGDV